MAKESFHILRGVCDAQVVTAVKTDFKAWRKVKVETRGGRRKEDRRHGWMDGWCDRKEERETREEKKEYEKPSEEDRDIERGS